MSMVRRSGGFRQPVEVGEEFEATIEAVGEKGDGLVRKDGFVVFVPNVKEGQKVRIKVTKVLRKVGFGEIIGQEGQTQEALPTSEELPDDQYEQEELKNNTSLD